MSGTHWHHKYRTYGGECNRYGAYRGTSERFLFATRMALLEFVRLYALFMDDLEIINL